MNEFHVEPQPPTPIVGEKLPGLLVHAEERPDGVEYWDQVVRSSYGSLFYAPQQSSNGTLRWVTNHGETLVVVESGSGRVLEIDEEHGQRKFDRITAWKYEMGMEAYRGLIRRIAADEDPTDLA